MTDDSTSDTVSASVGPAAGRGAARGAFITLEGIEGAGKSTVLGEVERVLHGHDIETLSTREPGGTGIAEQIRDLVLREHDDEVLSPRAEMLLVFAAREQHLREVIRPALEAGIWVLCDRFTDATLAYQGAGREQGAEHIRMLADWIHGDLWPDLTLLMDVTTRVGLARAHGRGAPDRFESESETFFGRVRQAYLEMAATAPQRFRLVDATATLPAVRAAVRDTMNAFVAGRQEQPA